MRVLHRFAPITCKWSARYIKHVSLFVMIILSFSFVNSPKPDPALNSIRIERHKEIPMRDGVKLYADIYLPKNPGRYPTIVVRTPYGVQRDGMHQTMVKYAQHGYAVVLQDVRGRYESDGKWEPFRDEANDGFDTIEWAAAQSFSNGKVGTQGGSYLRT